MLDQVLALRQEGKNYNQIAKTLNITRHLARYYANHEICKAQTRTHHNKVKNIPKFALAKKMSQFFRGYPLDSKEYNALRDSFLSNPICALTGRKLNLSKPETYNLDHIIPKARGGLNTIENCRLVCESANQAKRDMMDDEFLSLCRDIVNHSARPLAQAPTIL